MAYYKEYHVLGTILPGDNIRAKIAFVILVFVFHGEINKGEKNIIAPVKVELKRITG